jgi:two-component system C4-dicarboxylate transport sensor histidine kinase DctB
MGCSVEIEIDLQSEAMREKLARLYRFAQIGRCISSVTHDVNNFLGAIMAYAELVSMDSTLTEESNRMLAEIIGAVRKSSSLINNLTDVARKERADIRIVDPAHLVERVLDLRRYDLKVGHVVLACEYQPDLTNLTVDLPRLQQAMMYIVSNAIEAMELAEVRRLEMSVRMKERVVEFKFRDSGPGIPEGDRQRVFDPFFTTKGKEHIGLGLTVAKAIAEDHSGELVYSPDAGFVMRIPMESRYASVG